MKSPVMVPCCAHLCNSTQLMFLVQVCVVATGAVKADFGAEYVEAVESWVASKALDALQADAKTGQGSLKVKLDGKDLSLQVGKHVFWSAQCQ